MGCWVKEKNSSMNKGTTPSKTSFGEEIFQNLQLGMPLVGMWELLYVR
jgi:hypothetical protein